MDEVVFGIHRPKDFHLLKSHTMRLSKTHALKKMTNLCAFRISSWEDLPKAEQLNYLQNLSGILRFINLKRKNLHWWTRRRFSSTKNDQWYKSYFAAPSHAITRYNAKYVTVDGSASTIWDNNALFPTFGSMNARDPTILTAHLIHQQLPDAKCVVIVRNPVKRIYSDYLYFHKRSYKGAEAFHEAAQKAVDKFNGCMRNPNLSHMHCVYGKLLHSDFLFRLRIGLYYIHLRTWLSAFPANQLMVVRLEDYAKNTASILQDIYAFLGVKYMEKEKIERYIKEVKAKNTNTQSYVKHGEMLNKTKIMLQDFYRPYNMKLAELLRDNRFLYED